MNLGWLSKYRNELMGASCLWVMLFHNYFDWSQSFEILRKAIKLGSAGVDCFLILSGIGLYYSYSKMVKNRIRSFYWKRFVRLSVPYVMLALPFYLWVSWHIGIGKFLLDFFQISLFVNGLRTTWYITATAIFYLLFPFIYYLQQKEFRIRGRKIERGVITILMCVIVALISRCIMHHAPAVYDNCEIFMIRLIPFIIGCSLGKEVKENKKISAATVLGSIVFLISFIYLFLPEISLTAFWLRFAHTFIGLSVLIVCACFFHLIDRFAKVRKFYSFFGERSMELYLTHIMIRRLWLYYIGKDVFDDRHVLAYFCILLLSVIISTAIHPLIQFISKKLLAIPSRQAVK